MVNVLFLFQKSECDHVVLIMAVFLTREALSMANVFCSCVWSENVPTLY